MQPSIRSARFLAALASILLLAPSTADSGSFEVTRTNLNPTQLGTYDYALTQVNGLPDEAHQIDFRDNLENLQITLTDAANVPSIDVGVNGSVDLDASTAPGFRMRAEADPPAGFTVLHVASGTATLIDLDIGGASFQIDADGLLALRYSSDFEISDPIIGDGKLIKEGDSILTLTAANDYLGGTEVRSGELHGDLDSIQGDFDISDGALLLAIVDSGSPQGEFSGDISGEGTLAKGGDGLMSITGNATHTGGTQIRGGELLASSTNLSGDVAIAPGASFSLLENVNGIYAGNISGDGSVFKYGAGDLELTGLNSFTGPLVVRQMRVIGNTNSLPGDVEVRSVDSEVIFRQDTDGTHDGDIYGSGSLTKEGTGTVTLTGTTSHAGGTTVDAGRLRGDTRSLQGDIDLLQPGTSIEFSHADDQSFGGLISGVGDVYKTGGGRLTISTTQSFLGDVEIQAGSLRLDVDQSSSFAQVNVGSGAALTSSAASTIGIVGNLDVFGSVSPGVGSPTGVLNVGGNADFHPGSLLAVTVDENQQSSLLDVAGTATLAGGNVQVEVLPGIYDAQKLYSVLIAPTIDTQGGPGFTGTLPQYAFLDISDPSVVADPGGSGEEVVQISIIANSTTVSSYAETPNQASTANAVEELLTNTDPDVLDFWRNFGVLSVDEVPPALDALGGQTLGAYANARLDGAQQFNNQLSRRFSATEYEHGQTPGQSHPEDVDVAANYEPPRSSDGLGAWVDAFGVFDKLDGDGNTADMKTRSYGVSVGIDYRFPERLALEGSQHIRLGIAGGYLGHSIESEASTTTGRANGAQVAVYAAWQSPRFHFGGALRYAYTAMSTQREIVFSGLARRANADFDGNEVGALIEAGGRFGNPKVVSFRPLASIQIDHVQQNGFEEEDAGTLSLEAGDFSINSALMTLGAETSRLFTLDGDWGIEPELRLGWTHEFGDRGRHIDTRFYETGGTPFVGAGTEPDRDSAWIGAGYVMSISEVPLVSTQYDVYIGKNHVRHVISGGLLLRW